MIVSKKTSTTHILRQRAHLHEMHSIKNAIVVRGEGEEEEERV